MLSYLIYGTDDATGVSVSGTSTFYSDKISARDGQTISIHFEWSGTPTGTFTIWYSNKPKPGEANDTDWVQDTAWVPTNPAGSASKAFTTISQLTARHVRVKYVNASGSGALLAWASIAVNG